MLTERLHQRQVEKEELETQLAIENNKKICLSEAQILAFLDYVCEMPLDDFNKRRAIINIFVHSIYLYDDHFTLIINASKKPLSIENIPLDDIEAAFEGENTETEGCSSMMTPAPPRRSKVRFAPTSFYSHGKKNAIRPLPCSSFPTATCFTGLAVAFLFTTSGIFFVNASHQAEPIRGVSFRLSFLFLCTRSYPYH